MRNTKIRRFFALASAGLVTFQMSGCLPDNFWATELQLIGDAVVAGTAINLWAGVAAGFGL